MNEPSPLVPQGSFEAQARGKSRVKFAFYTIVIVHVLAIAGFLIIGCKREEKDSASNTPAQTNDLTTPAFGTDPGVLPTAAANTNPLTATTSTTAANVATAAGAGAASLTPTIPSSPVPDSVPAAATEHVIVKNDTLATLASHYKVPLKDIIAANPNLNPTRLQIGDKVKIPAKSTTMGNATSGGGATMATAADSSLYAVKSGDTLSKIATDHKTTVKEIQRLNNLSTTQIRVGQKLKMPPASSGGAAAPVGGTPPPAQ
jgi:peptidoglycan endopeptidase LytE